MVLLDETAADRFEDKHDRKCHVREMYKVE